MNVQNVIREGLHKRRPNDAHEARETDQVDIPAAELCGDRAIVVVSARKGRRAEHQRLDVCRARTGEPARLRSVGDDHGDRCVEAAVTNGVKDGLEIRSASGDQNREPPAHR